MSRAQTAAHNAPDLRCLIIVFSPAINRVSTEDEKNAIDQFSTLRPEKQAVSKKITVKREAPLLSITSGEKALIKRIRSGCAVKGNTSKESNGVTPDMRRVTPDWELDASCSSRYISMLT
jgi:hypothetical protein